MTLLMNQHKKLHLVFKIKCLGEVQNNNLIDMSYTKEKYNLFLLKK